MSHFTQIATRLDNIDEVVAAAKALGYSVDYQPGATAHAYGFMGDTTECLAAIHTHTRYDIGVAQGADGNLELIGDWDLLAKVGEIDQQQFTNALCQTSALQRIQRISQEQGLSVGEPTTQADGSMTVEVTQW